MSRAIARVDELPDCQVETGSEALELEIAAKWHPDIGHAAELPLAIVDEAKRLLAQVEALCEPVSPRQFELWIRPVLGFCSHPPDRFEPYIALAYEAFHTRPAGAFTRETRAAALRMVTYRPDGALIAEATGDATRALWARRDALRRIAGTQAVTGRQAPPTGLLGPRSNVLNIQPPLRTVEQQLRELGVLRSATAED